MMHTTTALYDALNDTLRTINNQLDTEMEEVGKRSNELLVAKAQILSGMAALKAADVTSKQARPRR